MKQNNKTRLLILIIMMISVCFSCKTIKVKTQSKFNAMVYDLSYQALKEIAAEHIDRGDTVLLLNKGELFKNLPNRFARGRSKGAGKTAIVSYKRATKRYPNFILYSENGFTKAIISAGGNQHEKLSLPPMYSSQKEAADDYLIFNTCPLEYPNWKEVKKNHDVQKILFYSIDKVIYEKDDYLGIKYSFKLIDLKQNGKISFVGSNYKTSELFPDEKKQFFVESKINLKGKLDDFLQNVPSNARTVLVKNDDIGVSASYVIAQEDLLIEDLLTNELIKSKRIDIIEKMAKREYKRSWQILDSIFYINAFLGGDYSEFPNYYNAEYMLSYRLLWNDPMSDTPKKEGEEKIYPSISRNLDGIYLKLINMETGTIVSAGLVSLKDENIMQQNFLYNCFNNVYKNEKIVETLSESGYLNDSDRIVVINRRMEVLNDYLTKSKIDLGDYKVKHAHVTSGSKNLGLLANVFRKASISSGSNSQKTHLKLDHKGELALSDYLYKNFQKGSKSLSQKEFIILASLANSWFEDGLIAQLSNRGYTVKEKLESIYSRYLIKKKSDSVNPFLSPVLFEKWDVNIKDFYKVDKVLYFAPMEKSSFELEKDNTTFLTIDQTIAGSNSLAELKKYYNVISPDLNWFLLSLVDISNGENIFNENVDCKR